MKHVLFSLLAVLSIGASALAAYDSSFYQIQFWSGEWPNGISVRKIGVVVDGRYAMDRDEAPSIACELPVKAVFHPWNEVRNNLNSVEYWTASKIFPMRAKEDFVIPGNGRRDVKVLAGEVVEWLIYYSEGGFGIRYMGELLQGDQDMLTHLEDFDQSRIDQQEWMKLNCMNGVSAWIFTGDLRRVNAAGEEEYIDGLAGAGNGIKEYGRAEDLTDEDLK